MKVAVLDDYLNLARKDVDWSVPGHTMALSVFSRPLPETLRERANELADFDVIVAMRERTPFPVELISLLPKLRLLVTTGMRNLSIDLAACSEQGIVVCGAPGSKFAGTATAELAWALILGLSKNIASEHAAMQRGLWQTQVPMLLAGKTLGVVGLGSLGQSLAAIGRAFGMRVVAYSPNLTASRAAQAGACLVSKDVLFRESDVVSIHMVLADSTRGLVDANVLSLMKPVSYLVNTSRAGLVDMDALYRVLQEKKIAGAGLDVFSTEPLPSEDRFRRLDNVLLTPHLGYVNPENMHDFYANAVKAIAAWANQAPINRLN